MTPYIRVRQKIERFCTQTLTLIEPSLPPQFHSRLLKIWFWMEITISAEKLRNFQFPKNVEFFKKLTEANFIQINKQNINFKKKTFIAMKPVILSGIVFDINKIVVDAQYKLQSHPAEIFINFVKILNLQHVEITSLRISSSQTGEHLRSSDPFDNLSRKNSSYRNFKFSLPDSPKSRCNKNRNRNSRGCRSKSYFKPEYSKIRYSRSRFDNYPNQSLTNFSPIEKWNKSRACSLPKRRF